MHARRARRRAGDRARIVPRGPRARVTRAIVPRGRRARVTRASMKMMKKSLRENATVVVLRRTP